MSLFTVAVVFSAMSASTLAETLKLPDFVLSAETRVTEENVAEVVLSWADMGQTSYTKGAEVKYSVTRLNKNEGAKVVHTGKELSFTDRDVMFNEEYGYIVNAIASAYGMELTFKTSNPVMIKTPGAPEDKSEIGNVVIRDIKSRTGKVLGRRISFDGVKLYDKDSDAEVSYSVFAVTADGVVEVYSGRKTVAYERNPRPDTVGYMVYAYLMPSNLQIAVTEMIPAPGK